MEHPKMFDDDDPLLKRVSELALALPGADLKVSHGRPKRNIAELDART